MNKFSDNEKELDRLIDELEECQANPRMSMTRRGKHIATVLKEMNATIKKIPIMRDEE
jgi:hypothetical protein